MSFRTASSQLCLHCGFCCDGTLFDSVPLREGEASDGLRMSPGTRIFKQPCQSLGEDLCCARYENRPLACRWFRCLLLTALEGGEVTLAGAKQLVDETRQQLRQIETWLGPHPSVSVMQAALTSVESQSHAQFEQVEALRSRLRFHFVGMSRFTRGQSLNKGALPGNSKT